MYEKNSQNFLKGRIINGDLFYFVLKFLKGKIHNAILALE